MKELHTEERHLGLHRAEEIVQGGQIAQYAEIFQKYLPLDRLMGRFEVPTTEFDNEGTDSGACCRFAIARDRAFSFYYEYNLEALRQAGAELVFFSPLDDEHLPENIAGIYFGGGYPELYAEALSLNVSLREEIKSFADDGMPMYAECGGLIYLGESIQDHESQKMHSGVGVFPYVSHFSPRLYLEYTRVEVLKDYLLGRAGTLAHGHVFHRSDTVLLADVNHSVSIYHETKKIHQPEGYTYRNVYAFYAHLHFKSSPEIPRYIIEVAAKYAAGKL